MASQAVGAVLLEPEDQVMYAFWPEVQSPKVQVLPSWLTQVLDWDCSPVSYVNGDAPCRLR